MNSVQILFLLVALPSFVVCADKPQYECEFVGKDTCNLRNVETTWENPDFEPRCSGSNCFFQRDIKVVEIISGKLPLLTNSLCSTLMHLEIMKLSRLSIEKIDDYVLGALNSCEDLKSVDLSYNNITKLDGSIFKKNWALTHLNLEGNPIKELPENFLPLTETLKEINLAGTLIPYFPFNENIRKLKGIEVIRLSHTPLLDLEIEKLILHIPSIKTIYLRDTNIPCSRMTEIRDVAARQGLHLEPALRDNNEKRKREYEVNYSGAFECLTKDQWTLEVMKQSVNDLMSETKFNTLLEMSKKNELKAVALDNDMNTMNENIDQYYVDMSYVSSYISFIGTTLAIFLTIISITSVYMCYKVRRYILEESFRNNIKQQQNFVIDTKPSLYF